MAGIPANERLLSLSEAAKALPHRPSVSTIWRWCRRGLRGSRLEYVRLGGRVFTSEEALRRFGAAMAASDHGNKPQNGPGKRRRTRAEIAAAVEEAKKKLS